MAEENRQPILEVQDLGIDFGGLTAVNNLNMKIYPEQIDGLIGPNGAGKTTVFNMLTKVYQPTRGKIFLEGKDMEKRFREGIERLASYIVSYTDNAPPVAFEKEALKKRGHKLKTLADCPVCGQGKIAENSRSFYCTRFREGCAFTIWKDTLTKSGGPVLDERLFKLCLERGCVKGSTGTIHYAGGQISFERTGK